MKRKESAINEVLERRVLRRMAGARSFERGEDYFANGQVGSVVEHEGTITAKVQGTRPYRVKLWVEDGELEYSCTCPLGVDGAFCKHCVAVGLARLEQGQTDWIRAVADQLAAEGFVVIAPDLLSGKGPGGGGTESVDRDGAVALIRGLQWNEIVARLNATAEYATSLPAARKGFATIGFCWGGRTSFAYAAEQPKLRAAVVYYGTSPPAETLGKIQAAVLGLYGGDDARVNQTIGPADAEMKRLGKRYEYEIYDGAGHGFLRAQEARDGANLGASEKAWPRTIALLRQQLGRD